MIFLEKLSAVCRERIKNKSDIFAWNTGLPSKWHKQWLNSIRSRSMQQDDHLGLSTAKHFNANFIFAETFLRKTIDSTNLCIPEKIPSCFLAFRKKGAVSNWFFWKRPCEISTKKHSLTKVVGKCFLCRLSSKWKLSPNLRQPLWKFILLILVYCS